MITNQLISHDSEARLNEAAVRSPAVRPSLHGKASSLSSQTDSKQLQQRGPRKLRVALYSHDTMGMGHMRRNLLISQALSHSSLQVSILMITGARQASAADMPPGVDCITLPALRKEGNGCYLSRSLDIPVKDLSTIRAQMIRTSIAAFKPDVFIVDNVPRGALAELDGTLRDVQQRGQTRCVLGLRDVLDAPHQVKAEWEKSRNEQVIRAFYDKVWIYGDPNVYNAIEEYQLPSDIADKVSFTGYFDRRVQYETNSHAVAKKSRSELGLGKGHFVLCMVGGGQDGARLTEAVAMAQLPKESFAVIITGPFMPVEIRQKLHAIAARRTNLQILEFVSEPRELLYQADTVIAMGGYNVVSEILSFEKKALIVPRTNPRQEQMIRAKRLESLGMIDVMHPDHISAKGLSDWLINVTTRANSPSVHRQCDFNGLSQLPALVAEICD